jgi:hypothetical protein
MDGELHGFLQNQDIDNATEVMFQIIFEQLGKPVLQDKIIADMHDTCRLILQSNIKQFLAGKVNIRALKMASFSTCEVLLNMQEEI